MLEMPRSKINLHTDAPLCDQGSVAGHRRSPATAFQRVCELPVMGTTRSDGRAIARVVPMNRFPRKPLRQDRPKVPSLPRPDADSLPWPHTSSRSEHAYGHIAKLIGSGMLRAGDALPAERLLGQVFDVARGSLRMALDLLKRDGMVRISHGKSTLVTGEWLPRDTPFVPAARASVTSEVQRVIAHTRRLTSTTVIDVEPCRVNPLAAQRLGLLVDMQQAAHDLPQFVIIDRQFHTELQTCCDVRELAPLLCLADGLTHSALRDTFEAEAIRSEVNEQHHAIVHAIERKDIRAAVLTLCDQLEMRIAAHPANL